MASEHRSVICKLNLSHSSEAPTAYNSGPGAYNSDYPDALCQGEHLANNMNRRGIRHVAPMQSTPPHESSKLCSWCLHSFTTPPVGMPVSRTADGKYEVEGLYCTLECATADLFDKMHASHNAYKRHALCCELASERSTTGPVYIRPAPKREMLYLFGGPLSIEDFRNSSAPYPVIYPLPIIAVSKHSEEAEINGSDAISGGRSSRFVPLDDTLINSLTNGLRRPKTSKRSFKSALDYMCAT